jgi:hypothetical protein
LVIYVLFNNNSSQAQTLASNLFSLTDAAGKAATQIKSLTQYSAVQASPGNTIQGTQVFEVSTANANFILSLALPHVTPLVWNFQVPSFAGPQGTPVP